MSDRQPGPVEPPPALAQFAGPNGVRVAVVDCSRPYGYADVFHVRLRAEIQMPGQGRAHERFLERFGVPASALGAVKRDLLVSFEARVLPYLFRPDFPERFAAHRLRSQAAVIAFPGAS